MKAHFSLRNYKLGLLSALLVLLSQGMLWAAPADRVARLFTQPDGSTLTTILQGDEHFNYFTTTDGVILSEDTDGYLKYATLSGDYDFIPSAFIAHDPEERSEEEGDFLTSLSTEDFKKAIFKKRNKSPLRAGLASNKFPSMGSPKGLVILAQYKDVKFKLSNPQNTIHAQMNERGYSTDHATGSVTDYFSAQSHGQFTPIFDVVGPITLSRPMAYYGQRTYIGHDAKGPEMIKEACEILSKEEIDFTQYDSDKDGVIDLVFVIYAGYSEAQGGPSAAIWPHAWTFSEAGFSNVMLGTVRAERYACTSELKGASGVFLDGIGTFCHEFSHCLGLPDFYDVNAVFMGNYGVGRWSIMDSGSYNNDSHTPAGYTSYERMFVGWLEPKQLTKPTLITLNPISTHNEACIISSDTNPNEYFLFENRQKIGWDAYLPGHGLMITHVDYSESAWNTNAVNKTGNPHPLLQIVPADEMPTYNDEEGDLYPGPWNNTEFSDRSAPAARLYSGGMLGKPVTNISEENGKITFSFMGGTVDIHSVHAEETLITLSKGMLHITTKGGQVARIYDLAGQEVAQISTVEGKNSLPLPSGNYVVAINGKSHKVLVP